MIFFALLEDAGVEMQKDAHIEQFIVKVAAGEKEALAELYRATHASVYGFSLSMLKSVADAEDVLQETYIKIWTSAGSYKANGTPMAWILTIAKNLALMKMREKRRHQDLEPEEWDLKFHTPDTAENTEERHLLMAALQVLQEEEKQIVMLHAVSGLKHREIAELLSLALPTVLSKYHRALKKLKDYIEGGNHND